MWIYALLLIGIIVYFLPGLIGRNKNNATAIALLNFFLGWTLVGWVVALVWALSKDNQQLVQYRGTKQDELFKLKSLLDNHVINEQEFQRQKERILNS